MDGDEVTATGNDTSETPSPKPSPSGEATNDASIKDHPPQLKRGRRRKKKRKEKPQLSVDLLRHHKRRQALRDKFIDHAPSVVGLSLFLFVIYKVLVVSRTNITTALAIMREAGVVQVVAGVLLLSLPFIGIALNNMAASLAQQNTIDPYERVRWWVVYGGLALALSAVLPWSITLIIIVFPILNLLLWRKKRNTPLTKGMTWEQFVAHPHVDSELQAIAARAKPLLDERKTASEERQGEIDEALSQHGKAWGNRSKQILEIDDLRPDALLIGLILTSFAPMFFIAANSSPWLPAEDIRLRSDELLTGHVLSVDSDWLTVLRHEPRVVEMISADKVVAREICTVGSSSKATRTIWHVASAAEGPPRYPDCIGVDDTRSKARVEVEGREPLFTSRQQASPREADAAGWLPPARLLPSTTSAATPDPTR